MDQFVAHSSNILPGDFRILLFDFKGYPFNRFTNNLKLANDAILRQSSRAKYTLIHSLNITFNLGKGISNMLKI